MSNNIEASYSNLLRAVRENPASKGVLGCLEELTTDIHKILIRVGLDSDYDKSLEDDAFEFFLGENAIEGDEQFKSFMKSSDYEVVSVDSLLDYISCRIDYLLSQKESLEELADSFGIDVVASKRVLLETMDLIGVQEGKGGMESVGNSSLNKSKLILGMLLENGFTSDDINVVTGTLRKKMMRKESYNCIEIASLGIKVFVNNSYGEATYILTGSESWSDIFGKTKHQLMNDFGAFRLKFNENDVDGWLETINEIIFSKNLVEGRQSDIGESINNTELDQNYYLNQDFVLSDLEKYAEAIGVTISDLRMTKQSRSVGVVLSNGKYCKWNTYVLKGAVVLGVASNRRDAESYKKVVIRKLQIIAGLKLPEIIKLDDEYFNNNENLRYDFEEFRKAQGKDFIRDVVVGRTEKVMCACGEELTIGTYLNNFGVIYENCDGVRDLKNTHKELLIVIFARLGLDFIGPIAMDEHYFTIENMSYDLEEFRKAQGKNSIAEIVLVPTYATCSNGEELNLIAYMERYGKVTCGVESKHEISMKHSEIREHMFSAIGLEEATYERYEDMDSDYFTEESASYDLRQFSEVIGVPVLDLIYSRKIAKKEAVCSNGELAGFRNFLHRAKVALGSGTLRRALDDLRLLGGFCSELIDPMGVDYFTEENLRLDFGLFCEELGVSNIGELELTAYSRYAKVVCSNGEEVTLLIYIGRVIEALFDEDKRKVSKESLRNIKSYLGYDVISEMDKEYFTVENVCNDLSLFAFEAIGDSDFRNLSFTPETRGIVAMCSNGESLSLRAYLNRAVKKLESEYPDINTPVRMLRFFQKNLL